MRSARTANLKVVPEVSAVDEHARAQSALAVAARELADARDADAAAQAAYDADGAGQATETAAMKARLARERAERRHAARAKDVEIARERLADEQRAQGLEELRETSAVVQSTPEKLAPAIRRLIELDRQVSAIVDEIADAVLDGDVAFERAAPLAESLATPLDADVRRPTMTMAQYIARLAIGHQRIREGRDLRTTNDSWLSAAYEPIPDPPNLPKPPVRNMPVEKATYAGRDADRRTERHQ